MSKTVFYWSKAWALLCFFCCAIAACNFSDHPKAVVPAFYHWKTKLQLTLPERSYLDSLGVKKLYAKFFDVDWDELTAQPVPLANIELDTTLLTDIEIVPTIFITNRSLLNLPMQEVDSLANRISQKIKTLAARPPREIQFDCDWTERTREKYFRLLESFRLAVSSSASISATIRLHQFKYPEKTGIPPVDRGMLMCYNMGDLEDWDTENSIIGVETVGSYLSQSPISYPIPIDLALPTFRWGVLFRDGEMIKLLNDLSDNDLQDTTRFRGTSPNRYEVVKSTYLNTHYLYDGDQIRLEAAEPESVQDVASLLNNKVVLGQVFTVAFYHFDATALRIFPKEKITDVLHRF